MNERGARTLEPRSPFGALLVAAFAAAAADATFAARGVFASHAHPTSVFVAFIVANTVAA